MKTILEKFGEKLVMLDMENKEDIQNIIKEIRVQIKAEIENIKECQEDNYNIYVPYYKMKMIFMICITNILKKLKNRYE